MSSYGRDNQVEEIKSRCDIVDTIGQVVTLKRAGSNFKGLCPFHNEKTPSFVVSDTKQIFTCFGCGASGDVIEFVKRYYHLEFPEALERLADQCGITLESYGGGSGKREELYEINREAARFFYRAMRRGANEGLDYMTARGMDEDVLKKFGVGYADPQWDSLFHHLEEKGYSPEKMLELGLISSSKGKYFDRFRNRVIFPIQNTGGKVIGFGARALGDDHPKYLNSQESSVFQKKNNLYGLNLTRTEMGKEDCAILVEGYMDVLSLYQGGVRNVSASLGTALTENQAKILKRYTRNIVLAYDGDSAGRAAAWRGMDVLHGQGSRVRVLHLPQGKDPDDFIKAKGKDAFIRLTLEAPGYADYKLGILKEQTDMSSTEGRLAFLKSAVDVLRALSPVEADMYIQKLARENNISQGAIRAEYEGGGIPSPSVEQRRGEDRHEESSHTAVNPTEKTLIKLLLSDSSYFDQGEELEELFLSPQGKTIFQAMKGSHKSGEAIHREKLLDMLEPEEETLLKDIENNVPLGGDHLRVYRDCVDKLRYRELKEKEKLLIARISMADEADQKEDIAKLTEELMETQKRILHGGRTR
ncbi:MAG: DNA primase [Anaerovoracaceae bacterium]